MAGFRINTVDGQEIAALSVSIAANGAIIAGVAGQKIRVYKMVLTIATGTTIQFQDGATNLSGAMTLTAGIPFVLPHDGNPWYTTSAGNAFNVAFGAGQQLSGTIYFSQSTFI
jgi:hypothetical protein